MDYITGTEQLARQANSGVEHLLTSNDIAIIALTTCLVFALIGNIVQYFVGNHRQAKDFDRYVNVIKALGGVEEVLDGVKALLSIIATDQRKH